jgi:hypothetical protein
VCPNTPHNTQHNTPQAVNAGAELRAFVLTFDTVFDVPAGNT